MLITFYCGYKWWDNDGKTCSARIVQWIDLKEWYNNHQDGAKVIIARVIYPLKSPSIAFLSCLDNDPCCWNATYLDCQNVIGVLPVGRCLTKLKYLSNIRTVNIPLFKKVFIHKLWPFMHLHNNNSEEVGRALSTAKNVFNKANHFKDTTSISVMISS